MKLNEKIAYCRRKQGLSQEVLAEKLGVSRQAVSKWETGDAVPEIGKLVLLAKTFGVTTDWLLSEEEPKDTVWNTYASEYSSTSGDTTHSSYEDWVDTLPRTIGKLVKRFGWLAGVYVAVSGAGVAAIGLLTRILSLTVVKSFEETTSSVFGNFGNGAFGNGGFDVGTVYYFDESGNLLNSVAGSSSGIMNSASSMLANNRVTIVGTLMLVLGVLLMIAGIIFAVILKKKSKEA